MKAISLAAALALSACTVALDERTAFQPPDTGPAAQTAAVLSDRADDVFAPLATAHAVTHGFLGDGEERIAYTLVQGTDARRPLIVHCGGNAADRRNSGVAYARKALRFGDVLLFDYPGYGDSGGAPSAAALQSAAARIAALADETAGGRRIVAWGHSLGGFVCGAVAQRLPQTAGLVFETSARNAREVADALRPWYAAPLVRVNVAQSLAAYDNAAASAAVRAPVLVIGARRDRQLPVRLSRSLAEAIEASGGRVTYVELTDAGHNNAPDDPAFPAALAAFFQSIEAGPL